MDEQPQPLETPAVKRAFLRVDRWLAPFLVFGLAYFVALVGVALVAMKLNRLDSQWFSLSAAVIATAFCIFIFDRGRWPIGFSGPPLAAARELFFGGIFAALLIGAADLIIALTTNLHHMRGDGFPWGALIAVYLPAAVHEELLFRGYPYQKMRLWSRPAAIATLSLLFAVAHIGNHGVTLLAFANLVIAGLLLALAYELYQRLWFPIGLHLAWNLVSGPIIGYPVSGFVTKPTMFVTSVSGPPALTGGAFGIEGSIAITIAELLAIGWLSYRMYHSPAQTARQELP